MANRTKVTDLANHPERFTDELSKLVGEMCSEVCEEAVNIIQAVSQETLTEVQSTAPVSSSPKGTGGHHLRDAFRLDSFLYKSRGMADYYNYGVPAKFVIHAPKWHKYSIVHLLEKGHLTAGINIRKPFVNPQPFMVPAEERAKQQIIARLRESGLTDK